MPPVTSRDPSSARRYALALAFTAGAIATTTLWLIATARPYSAPIAAVILSAWFGGFRPALVSLALSMVVISSYLAATLPQGFGVVEVSRGAIYVAISLLITLFARARESTERDARRQAAHLEAVFGQAAIGISLLSLDGRLMRYPLSYMIYSKAFDALPADARDAFYRRLWAVLSGNVDDPRHAGLSPVDRRSITEILVATKRGLPDYFR